ncbi:phosphopantetheine-binding protein [Methyloprofundus sp.]|uniref:phosphopantetheine-binding protein n=1 Tax=Methyloprofundus sp. TaxID=2020875 RepID=UPI003D0BEC35
MIVTTEEIRNIIIEETDTLENMETMSNDVSLVEQGVDSLDMANIYLLLEEKYGIKIPDADLDQLVSVDTIVSYLLEK